MRTLRESGLEIRTFRYVDKKTGSVDIDGLREDLLLAPERSAVLLWVAGSAPTGVDPSDAQWKVILSVCKVSQDAQK
jgi:aspartate aminotransferase